jgi:DNA-binding LacI/PurR family transcriptional regulator
VSPETRQKVLNLVKKLEFEPNVVAMNLRQHKTRTIGVVIPSFMIHFYSTAICGIHEVASQAGYNVMVCQNNESYDQEVNNVNSLIKSKVDGILISLSKHTSDFEHIRRICRNDFPVVLFNRASDSLNMPMVTVDDYQGAYRATEYLIQRGCSKIAHISGPSKVKLSKDRETGYRDCLRDHSLPIRESLILESDFSIESGKIGANVLMSMPTKPDAIFCVCDAVAFGAMMVLKKRQIRIPQEVSIIGFTDEPVAELVNPPLTTIAQPIYDIGKVAGQMLLDMINGKIDRSNLLKVVLPTKLIVRQSTI